MSFNKDEFDLGLSPYYAIGQIEGTIRGLRSNDTKIKEIAEILDKFNEAKAADLVRLETAQEEFAAELLQEELDDPNGINARNI